MIQIAVCDDEASFISDLSEEITNYMAQKQLTFKITGFLNANDLLDYQLIFDAVFLDIRMPGISGIDAAQKLYRRNQPCMIIFVTALPEYVYDAFEVEAVDYLIKPLDKKRLYSTLDRMCRRIEKKGGKSLLVKGAGWCKSVRIRDILYCEVFGRKVYIHTTGEVIEYYCRLEQLEHQLGAGFFRCHRSCLVNLKHVHGYENGMAIIENGSQVPVSRLRGQAFMEAILQVMKEKN